MNKAYSIYDRNINIEKKNDIKIPNINIKDKLKAIDSIQDFELRLYQFLYSYGLTNPDREKARYTINLKSDDFRSIYPVVEVKCNVNYDYDFCINIFSYTDINDLYDVILENINLIENEINNNKVKNDKNYCCSLAEKINCVCIKAYRCPIHGENHLGNHD